jgi:hypothetical protein
MHRKAFFILAGIFLIVALAVPPIILIQQAASDLDNYIVSQNPSGHQTNGNVTIFTPEQLQENHTTTFIIVAAIDVIFVALFAITLYYGVNHPHPEH